MSTRSMDIASIAVARPVTFATKILGFTPDPAQTIVLESNPHRCILNCTRQWGKSTITAIKALHHALMMPRSLTIVISPSSRQSSEFLRKISAFLPTLGIKPRRDGDNEISLLLPNSSRIVGLPGVEATVRGFSSVSLLLIDEASRVPDELYHSVRPMVAQSRGQIWLMSTPNGPRGFFYQTWRGSDPDWLRIAVPATECPRIPPEFLTEERATLGESFFRQEYMCEFLQSSEVPLQLPLLRSAITDDVQPLYLDWEPESPFHSSRRPSPPPMPPTESATPDTLERRHFFIGCDLGQSIHHTAVSVLECAIYQTGERSPVDFSRSKVRRTAIRYLKRFPLGMTYDAIAQELRHIARHPDIRDCTLILDATSVGKPVLDNFKRINRDTPIVPITLSAAETPSREGNGWRVPVRDLVTNLALLLEKGHLKIAKQIPDAENLVNELLATKATHAGGDSYATPGNLALSTALACWYAQQKMP